MMKDYHFIKEKSNYFLYKYPTNVGFWLQFINIRDAMIQEGYGEEGFTEALLEREKDYPTGLDVDGIGVAIPHTDAEHVKKEGISIAVLDQPIAFDAMGEDDCQVPVKIVIMFTVAGKDKHIDRLLQILDMIKDEQILKGLLEATNKEEIRTAIQKREKTC